MEGYGESHKKAPLTAQKLHESKRGTLLHSIKDSKTQSNLINGRKDTLMIEDSNNVSKKRESSSEDDSSSYSKYEKDVPELRGPIKDFSQYREYVQEYHDKYDSYCSLNRILESYRNEFHKLGKDLESAKGRDMDRYHNIVMQLKESYSQCGMVFFIGNCRKSLQIQGQGRNDWAKVVISGVGIRILLLNERHKLPEIASI
ncbi:hypothetical protein OIU76_004733 [Salix suchowensis]|nr:hypothetical protein OIU76_004733 [Salix suchowensis]